MNPRVDVNSVAVAPRIREALLFVSPTDYETWVRMGMAVKSELGEDGYDVWKTWSEQDEAFDENAARYKWKSLRADGGVTAGTLFFEAKKNGWVDAGEARKPMPNQIDERARQADERAQKEAGEVAVKRAKAAQKAAAICKAAMPAEDDHPYLERKQVAAVPTLLELDVSAVAAIIGYTPKQDATPLSGRVLVAPVKVDYLLTTCELIDMNGRKSAIYGGAKAGGYWSVQALPDGDGSGATLFISEGVATTLSIHEAIGAFGVAALSANNLLAVAKAMRKRYPAATIVMAADLGKASGVPDHHAIEASRAIDGLMVAPEFGPDRSEHDTDFNDMAARLGLDAVRLCINATLDAYMDAKGTPHVGEAVVIAASSKGDDKRVAVDSIKCTFGGGKFEVSSRGVFFIGTDKDGNEQPPRWICSPLFVIAMTRDAKSGEWGRLLEWYDDDGVLHRWAMPLELLQSDGADMRRELARMGLNISPVRSQRDLLGAYVQVWPVQGRARCAERLGWHGAVYLTPSETIGEDDEIVVFQNAHALEPAFSVSGTLDEWRAAVAAPAAGNSRLVFALCVAFAGPLADIAGEDSGGFHLRGTSSSGKTTALKLAASVWGDPNIYPRLWRATANGLEGLAALHNDGLLILDELSQIDPKEAGEAAYLLANGQGKARASRTGTARQAARWRLLVLSAGEESLSSLMARAGRKSNAGQEIRLADIEADAGCGMGAFEALHGQPSPAALALALKDGATRFHGSAGLAWLRRIVMDRPKLADMIADGIAQFVSEAAPKNAVGQALRVARRFALVAAAGELASHYGLTGWPEGEASRAAHKCFAVWLDAFGGTGNREERNLKSQVRAFFEAHGASRFEDLAANHDQRIINRAGFYRNGATGAREFLVLPEAFRRDVCQGFDVRAATAALMAAEWLQPGKDGRYTQKPRIPGIGPTRCYVLTGKMWEDE